MKTPIANQGEGVAAMDNSLNKNDGETKRKVESNFLKICVKMIFLCISGPKWSYSNNFFINVFLNNINDLQHFISFLLSNDNWMLILMYLCMGNWIDPMKGVNGLDVNI